MITEHVVGNITFRQILDPEKPNRPKVGLMIGGISLMLQETTWNSLARLVNEVGEIHSDNDEVGSETSGDDGEMTDSAEEAESMESTEV